MATPLPVNQLIDHPDIVGSFQRGQQIGRQNRLLDQQEKDRTELRQLAPQVIAGDKGAYGQAAAIDPQAANQYDDARMRTGRQAYNIARQVVQYANAGQHDLAQNLWTQALPMLRAIKPDVPETFGPEQLAQAQIILAAQEGQAGASGIQSTYIDDQGNRVAVLRNGSTQILGGSDLGKSKQTISVTGPDGREAQYTFDSRTGNYVPAALGGQDRPNAAPPQGPPGQRMISNFSATAADGKPISAEELRAVQASAMDPGARIEMQGGKPVNVGRVSSPFVGRSPEEQAALTTAAQEAAKLQYAPQNQAIETQAAIDRTAGVEAAKAQAERANTQRDKDSALRLYEAGVQGLKEGLNESDTGPLLGRIPAFTTGQQIAEGSVAAMAPILKQLFRAGGEGTFTDKDQELLLKMVPTRTDTPEARASKIANIDRIVHAKLSQPAPARPAKAQGGWSIQAIP